MESSGFLPFWLEGEIDGSVKGGGMRRFQFPIKRNQPILIFWQSLQLQETFSSSQASNKMER